MNGHRFMIRLNRGISAQHKFIIVKQYSTPLREEIDSRKGTVFCFGTSVQITAGAAGDNAR